MLAFSLPLTLSTPTTSSPTSFLAAERESTPCPSAPKPPPPGSPQTYIDVEALNAQKDGLINKNDYVFNVTRQQIKEVIYPFVKNKDSDFSINDIVFDAFEPNREGSIRTIVSLKRYKNEFGEVHTGPGFTPVCIEFGPYLPAPGITEVNVESQALPNDNS